MMAQFYVKCALVCIALFLCVDLISAGGAITSDLWINAPTPANPPSPRHSHSAVFNPVNKSMVVFGGVNANNVAQNDVSAYTVDSDTWDTDMEISGESPMARFGHSAVVTGLNTMVVFGGTNGTEFFNDVSVFDLVSSTWLNITTTGQAPPPRAYHTAVVDRYQHAMYVYGGSDVLDLVTSVGTGTVIFATGTASFFSDMWVLDLDHFSWSRVVFSEFSAQEPSPRACHSALMTQMGVMVVFGGFGLSDVACFDVRNSSWYSCVTQESPAPSVRYGHSTVFSPLQQMVVYGGRNSAGYPTGDVWAFDLTTWHWEVVLPGGASINPRGFHAAVATTFGSMIVFGGVDGDNAFTSDFGLYNLASTVLRSADDGVVLVVLVTLLGTILLVMCFAMDYMQEQNIIDKNEAVAKARAETQQADQLLIPKLPTIPKALQIPLGPRAQKFFDEIKMSLDPMQDPPK